MRSTSCGTARSGGMPGRCGAPGCGTRQPPPPPQLGPPHQWPACMRRAGLFRLRLAQGVERALLDEFLYRLYGMYLAALAARMAAGRGPGGPQGLHVPGLAATAALQPLPFGRFSRPPTGGRGPQTAAPSARGPARVALGSGLCLGLGPVGTGAGLDAKASGSIVGRAGPRLRGLRGEGAPSL